ncbi:hypothetical protein [Mycobacterium tilburgii]|uniref:hypothetical protein n=1 Tax=Mycobacterium tilburgii TaxID=44467 RepID=UPI0011826A72|nr:hypothetical protein [Mycobacterium tilburgii]
MALRVRLGRGVAVRRVQYRLRGCNSPRLDAVADAAALDQVRRRYEPKTIVVVAHSMGRPGRGAAGRRRADRRSGRAGAVLAAR